MFIKSWRAVEMSPDFIRILLMLLGFLTLVKIWKSSSKVFKNSLKNQIVLTYSIHENSVAYRKKEVIFLEKTESLLFNERQ